jgi:predicted permease
MALALIAGVVFGVVPAFRALRNDLVTDLKDGGPTETHTKGRLRSVLIAGQIALSMVLVIASGLLIRSASEVRKGTNFDPKNLLVLRLRPELLKYTQPQIEALLRRVEERLRGTPDVQSVAFMQGGEGLVWDWQSGRDAEVNSTPVSRLDKTALQVRKQDVSSVFFETLKIPILGGREFNEQDRVGSPRVAIVNETLAQRMWPAGSAVGHNLYVNAGSYQVIGVCANLQPENSRQSPEPHLYLSYWQSNSTREGDIRLAIRVFGNPFASLQMLRRAIQSVDPKVPVGEDMPLSEQVSLEYMPVLLAQSVMSFCGLLALCLSAMGLYSVLAFAVRMRSREIGIRMALGARRQDILRLVVGEGAKLALTGAAAGSVAALISTRLLAGLLYGVRTSDPATYAGVTMLLLLVALAACCLPASRAASIDPMQALRDE